MNPADVTACLVTRGNIDLRPILDTLIFPNVVVWDNSVSPNCRTFGRYAAMIGAGEHCYLQDDDVIVHPDAQWSLLNTHLPGQITTNYPEGLQPPIFDDLAFLGFGAIVDRSLVAPALAPFLNAHLHEEGFQTVGCDILLTMRSPVVRINAGYQLRPEAEGPGRSYRHPSFQKWKWTYYELAKESLSAPA